MSTREPQKLLTIPLHITFQSVNSCCHNNSLNIQFSLSHTTSRVLQGNNYIRIRITLAIPIIVAPSVAHGVNLRLTYSYIDNLQLNINFRPTEVTRSYIQKIP